MVFEASWLRFPALPTDSPQSDLHCSQYLWKMALRFGKGRAHVLKDTGRIQMTLTRSRSHPTKVPRKEQGMFREVLVAPPSNSSRVVAENTGPGLFQRTEHALRRS